MNNDDKALYKEQVFKGIYQDRAKNEILYRYQNIFIDDSKEGFNKVKKSLRESRSYTPKETSKGVNQAPSPIKCNIIRPNDLLNINSVVTAKGLLNKVQISLGKLNDISTKELAFNEMQTMIAANREQKSLRLFLGALSNFKDNCSLSAKEYQVLLYGFIARVFRDELLDPFDKPPNIIKTINRMLSLIRNNYLQETSYIIHKACAHSMLELFDYCMPKDDSSSDLVIALFFDPLLSFIATGMIKCLQEGAAICLSDMILSIGSRGHSNLRFQTILKLLMDKVVPQMLKGANDDNQYVIEALYHLISYSPFGGFSYYLKELYERLIFILRQRSYSYLTKINSLKVFALIAKRLLESDDYIIGYFQANVIEALKEACKDRIHKVQLEAKEALRLWLELEEKFAEGEMKKVNHWNDTFKEKGMNEAVKLEMQQYNNQKDTLIDRLKGKKRKEESSNDQYIKIANNARNNSEYVQYISEANTPLNGNNATLINSLKHSLSTLIIGSLGQTLTSIESTINSKLNSLGKKINEVYIKLPKTGSNPHYNQKPQIPSSIQSQTLSQWQAALNLLEQNNHQKAFETILSTEDDIYLLRLLFLSGPILDKLSLGTSKKILTRMNLISRSSPIQSLLLKLISQAHTLSILSSLSKKEQNDIMDSLYHFSSNQSSSTADEASKLYSQILSNAIPPFK